MLQKGAGFVCVLSHSTLFTPKEREATGMKHGFQFLHVHKTDCQTGKFRKIQWEEEVGDAHDGYTPTVMHS